MVYHARTELPFECCGLLAGRVARPGSEDPGFQPPVGQVVKRYPLVNATASPIEYLSDPRSMFEAVRDMRRLGLEILAIYHSHPTSDPVPSRTDLERNYSPDVLNLIISFKTGKPEVRGWWLTDQDFREAEWETRLV
jgi:proteasome lid subunit RPN8/RPN11